MKMRLSSLLSAATISMRALMEGVPRTTRCQEERARTRLARLRGEDHAGREAVGEELVKVARMLEQQAPEPRGVLTRWDSNMKLN